MTRLHSSARQHPWRASLLVAACVGLLLATGALAYFVSSGSATASASVGAINPPTSVTSQQTGANVTIDWSAATLSSGGAVQGYVVTRSDGATICGSPTLDTSDSCTDTGVPAGSYTYTVTAVFGGFTAAAASSSSLTILTTPTITAAPSDPSANAAPSFDFNGGGGSGYQCQLDGGAFTPCSNPDALSGLSNGSHTFQVEATQGNSTGPATTYNWTVDTSAPSITGEPTNPSGNAAPPFSFSHTESTYTFKCQLDGGGYSACTSPDALSGLSNGSHTFQVEAVSVDGAATQSASYSWTVDTTPPSNTLSLAGTLVWGNSSSIGRGNTDGSGVNESLVTGLSTPVGVAVDGSHVYWASYFGSGIGRANLDGSGVNQSFVTNASFPEGLAVDDSYVYWAQPNSNSIGRANIDGTGATQTFITGANSPEAVAVNGSYIYWVNEGTGSIGRANLNGTGVNQSFITGGSNLQGIAVGGSYIYWTNSGTNSIGRAQVDSNGNLISASVNQSFITGADYPLGVAVDGAHVYWSNAYSSTIDVANLDGSGVESLISGASYRLAVLPAPASAYLSGSTLYFNGNTSGSFNLTDTATDSGSNPVSAGFPAIATGGWTHDAETVTSGSGLPPSISYTSSAFSWSAGAGTPSGYLVSSTDALGNTGSLPVTFVDDTTAPSGGALTVAGTAASGAGSAVATASTSFAINSRTDYTDAGSGLASSVLTVQSGSLTGSVCGAPGSGGPFTAVTTITGTSQPSGITAGYCYLYTLTGTDNVGNAASISTTVAVDIAAPSLTAEPSNPSANTSPSFSFSHTESAYTFKCQLDGSGFSACASAKSYSGLSNASHTFRVEGVDAQGNPTAAASYTWTVDNTAPSITSKPASLTNSTSASFSFTHTESAYTFRCQLDGGGFSACTSPHSLSGLGNGSHTFQVEGVSTDGATTTPASYTWTVDTTAPTNALSLAGTLVWSNFGANAIGRANLDGTSPNQSFITGATNPNGVGVDGSYVFWLNSNGGTTIGRANLNGSGANESFITGDTTGSTGVAVGGSYVYWGNHGLSSIGRATIDGTGVNQSFISTGAGDLRGVAVDSSYVYWTDFNSNSIGRANLNGTGVNPTFITGLNGPSGVAVDGSYVYWTNSGTNSIGRANLNGSSPNPNFITGANYPYGVAVNSSYVYWANLSGNTIGRANLNGTNPNESFITGATSPANVAVVPSSGSAFVSGSTVYYNGNSAGSFNLTDTATDSGSNPVSASFPAISTTGWTHNAETVTSGSGSPPSISYTSSFFSWTANPSSPTGYSVSSTDALGNTGSLPVTFVDDTTAPSGAALSVDGTAASGGGSSSATTSTSFSLNSRTDYTDTGAGVASSVLTVQSESLTGSTCGTPGSGGPFTTATTITGTSQPSGITAGYCYLYTLTGTDNVGNAASLSTTVTVDNSAPSITSKPSNPSANTSPSFSFSHTESAYTFKCQLDGGGYSACTSPDGLSGLGNGSHTFQVEGVDAQGNPTSVASYTWTVDTTAPSITSKPASVTNSASASFSFTHAEGSYTFRCQLDGGGFSACASGKSYSSLSNASHTFQVEGVSSDGATTTPASYTWTVDASTPATPTLAFSGLSSNAYYASGDNTLYVRPAAGGGYTVTASSSAPSGIASYSFSSLASSNFSGTQNGGQEAYTFGASATQPGTAPTVSATSNSGNTSANASYNLVSDTTAPTAGALSVDGTAATAGGSSSTAASGSFSIDSRTDYAEAQSASQSGLSSSTLTIQSESLGGTTCGSPGSAGPYITAATITGTTQPSGITTGFCYLYTLTGADNVGNTASISTTVKDVKPQSTISTVAGNGTGAFSGDGGPATSGELNAPFAVAVDPGGNQLIADAANNRVRLVAGANCASACPFGLSSTTAGDIYTVAGNGTAGNAGNGGAATSAELNFPDDVSIDGSGDLLIADSSNAVVRLVAGANCSATCPFGLSSMSKGDIYTVAGNGTAGYSGNGGTSTSAELNHDNGVGVDGSGDLLIADSGNGVVRLVAASNCATACPFGLSAMTAGDIYTVAGTGTNVSSVTLRNGAAATSSPLNNPAGVAVDGSGDLLVTDTQNHQVQLVAASNCSTGCPYGLSSMTKGAMYTVAGSGGDGFSGAGGPAINADFNWPYELTVDGAGDLLFPDYYDGVLWMVAASNCSSACPYGLSSTTANHVYVVAGTGSWGYSGDGGPASSATLNGPTGVAVESDGDLLIGDMQNNRIRLVTP